MASSSSDSTSQPLGTGLVDRLLAQLGRVTTTKRFIPEVDGLRFVAIGMVVLFHFCGVLAALPTFRAMLPPPGSAQPWLRVFSELGNVGVELFFVISGFILGVPFATHALLGEQPVQLGRYFTRRLTRLEPPYLLSLLIFFAAGIATRKYSFAAGLPHLFASTGYLHNLVYGDGSTINGVAWSLEVEVQFYVLAPLLASVYRISSAGARYAVFLGAIVAAVVLQHRFIDSQLDKRLWLSLPNFVHFFLIGMLLADLHTTRWAAEPSRNWFWDVVWLAAVAIFPWVGHDLTRTRFALPVLFGLMMVAVFRGVVVRWALTLRPIVVIGGMCYSIYLFHAALLAGALYVTRRFVVTQNFSVNFLFQLALVAPVVIIGSAVYFRLIERPFMQWQLRPRRVAAPAAEA